MMRRLIVVLWLVVIGVSVFAQPYHFMERHLVDIPESEGLSSEKLDAIAGIADDAIRAQAFPGCQVLVARNGRVVYYKTFGFLNYDRLEPVTENTVYDLASVTKISATTVSVMKLVEEKKLSLTEELGTYLPWVKGTNKEHLKIADILLHQAGLVAYIPFYKETINPITGSPLPGFYKMVADSVYSVRVAENMYLRRDWKDTLYSRIVQSKLLSGGKYIYSDNDFIFLGKVVEQITGQPLDKYADLQFYKPLGMYSTMFKPKERFTPVSDIAPTEKEFYFRMQILRGDVHDPGAAMFGGVAGHAGLFSNAFDLAKLYLMLLNGGSWNGKHYFDKHTIDDFTGYHSKISRRGYGFDKPEKDNATNGDPYPTIYASPQTFGHTGFTGTCVWADPKENLLFIFLSNRVCPDGGANNLLSKLEVRRNMLNAVYGAILK